MVDNTIKSGKFTKETFINGTPPIKRLRKPEEIAEVVLWLYSLATNYIIGQLISVDGGLSII